MANDKLIAQAVLEQREFPVSKFYGLYHSYRVYGSKPSARNSKELAQFIRKQIEFPFVCKPIWGISGHDVTVVESVDRDTDTLTLGDGQRISVEDFSKQRESFRGDGHLFQEMLKPSADMVALCRARICSVRIVVLVHDRGPQILMAFWKVATGNNMTDNYGKRKAGNIIGTVDLETGRVTSLVHGRGRNALK